MTSEEEKILKVVKEIVIKFIEMGRLSPSAFPEHFKQIYNTVRETIETSKTTKD